MNQESKSTLSTPSSPFGKFLDREYCLMVRGLGMLAIVYGHTVNEFMPILEKYHLTMTLGLAPLGTAICFFLSGFGLTMSFAHNNVDKSYIYRHLRGLFLPYLIFWLLWVTVGCVLGTFPSEQNLFLSFLTLAMPNADAWFFKSIVVIYIVYMLLRRFFRGYERISITILILCYVSILAYFQMPAHLWARMLCFPLGIMFASYSSLRKPISLLATGMLFLLTMATIVLGGNFILLTPLFLMLFLAYASPRIRIRLGILSWIGANSIYVYLMEAIPMDYMNSQEVGILVFVLGGIGITLVLSHFGRSIERFINRKVFNYSV